jgi:hypothetical protein
MKPMKAHTLRGMVASATLVALGIILPIAFHTVGLGAKFMPMVLVIMLSGFLAPWPWAMLAGAVTPMASALLTGMPAVYPPFCLVMSLEMALTAGLAALLYGGSRRRLWPALLLTVLFDRTLSLALTYFLAGKFGLPPRVVSLVYFAQALIGVALQLTVIPLVVSALSRRKGILFFHEHDPETPVL